MSPSFSPRLSILIFCSVPWMAFSLRWWPLKVVSFSFLSSFDVRGNGVEIGRHWNDGTNLGPRARFDEDARPFPLLWIEDLREDDQGQYRCRVDFRLAPTKNFKINLGVIGKNKTGQKVHFRNNLHCMSEKLKLPGIRFANCPTLANFSGFCTPFAGFLLHEGRFSYKSTVYCSGFLSSSQFFFLQATWNCKASQSKVQNRYAQFICKNNSEVSRLKHLWPWEVSHGSS